MEEQEVCENCKLQGWIPLSDCKTDCEQEYCSACCCFVGVLAGKQ